MKLLDLNGLSRFLDKVKALIPTKTSELQNDSNFTTADSALSGTSTNAIQNKVVKDALDGKANSSHTHGNSDITSLDASKITSGTIDIARLPAGALERLVTVADQIARYALTTSDVQLGDTVKQLDTGVMYIVTDVSKLSQSGGYTEYTAGSATSVPWSGVTGKPSDYTPSSHTHGNVTNDGKIGSTANLPLITGTSGTITTGSFGTSANTFCEGNDSRLSDARTPVSHTHVTADVTDLLSDTHTWTSQQSYNSDLNLNYASTDVDDIVDSTPGTGTADIFVHNTGAETISGVKTFSDGIVANVSGNCTKDGNGNVITSTYGALSANNTWSRNNTFTGDEIDFKNESITIGSTSGSGWQAIAFRDVNSTVLAYQRGSKFSNGNTCFQWKVFNTDNNSQSISSEIQYYISKSGDKTFTPVENGEVNLGTSTNQWNKIYGKEYYYNGTAWGLDKANVWTGTNTFSTPSYGEMIRLKNTSLDLSNGNPSVSSACNHIIWWDDKNDIHYAKVQAWTNNNTSAITLTSYFRTDANTVLSSSLRNQCGSSSKSFFPESNGDTDLGISTNKWKTLNGINPGALSLPDISRVTNIDTTGWTFDGNALNQIKINNAVQTLNGWLYIRLANVSNTDSIGVRYISIGKENITFTAPYVPSATHMTLSCPIVAGVSANVWLSKQPEYIKFYLSLGEVNNFPS